MSNYTEGLSDHTIERRFERVENKIDALVNAVTELVKAEVVMKNMEVRLNAHSEEIKHLDKRLDAIEVKVPVYDLSNAVLRKISFTIITLAVTALAGGLFVVTN